MKIIWCIVPEIVSTTDKIFSHFGPFYTPNNPENQNFEKIKRAPGDIIILHKCTTNENHMRYGSWDMKHNKLKFLSFAAIFCPFTPLTTPKIKLLKKWKPSLEVSSFNTSVPKIMIICYTVPEIWRVTHDTYDFYFSFWTTFCPLQPKK